MEALQESVIPKCDFSAASKVDEDLMKSSGVNAVRPRSTTPTDSDLSKTPATSETGGSIPSGYGTDDEIFYVEKILKKRVTKEGNTLYYVKWRNYENKFNTWEPPSSFHNLAVIEQYELRLEKKLRHKKGTKKRRYGKGKELQLIKCEVGDKNQEKPANTNLPDCDVKPSVPDPVVELDVTEQVTSEITNQLPTTCSKGHGDTNPDTDVAGDVANLATIDDLSKEQSCSEPMSQQCTPIETSVSPVHPIQDNPIKSEPNETPIVAEPEPESLLKPVTPVRTSKRSRRCPAHKDTFEYLPLTGSGLSCISPLPSAVVLDSKNSELKGGDQQTMVGSVDGLHKPPNKRSKIEALLALKKTHVLPDDFPSESRSNKPAKRIKLKTTTKKAERFTGGLKAAAEPPQFKVVEFTLITDGEQSFVFEEGIYSDDFSDFSDKEQ